MEGWEELLSIEVMLTDLPLAISYMISRSFYVAICWLEFVGSLDFSNKYLGLKKAPLLPVTWPTLKKCSDLPTLNFLFRI